MPIQKFTVSRDDSIYEAFPDVVLTSGLGGVFPEGLPVGRVGQVRMHASGLYRQADVIPAARMDSFRYAFVVMEQE